MKKIFSLLLLLAFAAGTAMAQDAEAIVERYYKLSGMDKVDIGKATVAIDMDMDVPGMTLSMSSVMRLPDKMKIEMDMRGQKIIILVDGDRGVMEFPGMGRQNIPEEQLKEMKRQNDMLSSMKWDLELFSLTYKGTEQKDDKTFDIVEMSPKSTSELPIKHQAVYFDRETGLLDSATVTITTAQGDMTVNTLCSDYVRSGEILYPSKITASMRGMTTTINIRKMVVNCPVDDAVFEIGE